MSADLQLKVILRNRQQKYRLQPVKFKRVCAFLVQNEWNLWGLRQHHKMGKTPAEFVVHCIEEKEMCRLHEVSHQDASPTDVISYGYLENIPLNSGEWVLGEIFISVTEAKKASRKHHTQVQEELLLYLVHGILHCFGYDDMSQNERRVMRERERYYMDVLQHMEPFIVKK